MEIRHSLSWAAVCIVAVFVVLAGGEQSAPTSPAQKALNGASVKPERYVAYKTRIREGRFQSATLYYDTVDREGAFEPDDIIASSFSEICSLSKVDVTTIIGSLDLLKPVRDQEAATNRVNMALVFRNSVGLGTSVYFFYSIEGGTVNAVIGGLNYRTSSDFPQRVVKIARKRCGRYWPFPFKV